MHELCRGAEVPQKSNEHESLEITPHIGGWRVECNRERDYVFTDFKELVKFLKNRCKPLPEKAPEE